MNKQKEKFDREIEITGKNQTEILVLNNTMNEMQTYNREHQRQT